MKRPPKPPNEKKQGLSSDDAHIWNHVTRTVNAYRPARKAAGTPALRKPLPPLAQSPRIYEPRPSRAPEPQIAADKRVRRGKIEIDRKIDLHDMTQNQAYGALVRCLHNSTTRGHRTVLVVTGKGPVSTGGVLKRMLPIWLASADIRPVIASYAPAHARHGGAGAWYVFLKTGR